MRVCRHKNHQKCIESAFKKAEEICAQENLRLTDARRRVLEIIWQSHKALTAAEVMEKLGNSQPPVTYRALEFLEKHGFVHKVVSLNAYVGCQSPDMEHASQLLICTTCKDVREKPLENLLASLQEDAKDMGFQMEQVHTEILGQCKSCQQEGA